MLRPDHVRFPLREIHFLQLKIFFSSPTHNVSKSAVDTCSSLRVLSGPLTGSSTADRLLKRVWCCVNCQLGTSCLASSTHQQSLVCQLDSTRFRDRECVSYFGARHFALLGCGGVGVGANTYVM